MVRQELILLPELKKKQQEATQKLKDMFTVKL